VAYAIADNRTAELAEWDDTALAEQLRALQSEEFDVEAAGFTGEEIDGLIEGLGNEILGIDDGPENDFTNSKTTHRHILKFGDITIPITELEYQALHDRLEEYHGQTGTNFGFCADLLGLQNVKI
jgi:hypothetical protein